MHNDLSAVGSSHSAELNSQSDSSRRTSDKRLESQLMETLQGSRQPGVVPPRVDVVTAIDKLQMLSQLLRDERSCAAIERLIGRVRVADPTALAKQTEMIRMVQTAMAQPVNSVAVPQTKKIEKSSKNEKAKLGKKPHLNHHGRSESGLSKLAKRTIKFLFG